MKYINQAFITCYHGSFQRGCGRRLIRFLNHILDNGGTVHIACTSPPPITHDRVKIISANLPVDHGILARMLFAIKLLKTPKPACSSLEVNYFTFDAHNAFYLWLLMKMAMPAPTVFIRGNHQAHLNLQGMSLLERLYCNIVAWAGIKISKKLIYNSHYSRIYSEKNYRNKRSSVVPNDIPRVRPTSLVTAKAPTDDTSTTLTLGLFGQFIPRKNFLYVLASLEGMLRAGGLRLVIQGDGPQKGLIENYLQQHALAHVVALNGWSSRIEEFYSRIDVLLVPSIYDDCPNVVLEALAMGKCVLGSRNTGVAELLGHSESLTFSLDDQGESLRDRIRLLLETRMVLEQLTRQCQGIAESLRFDWEHRMISEI